MDIKHIISGYISGNLTTEEEKEYLLQWLEQSVENRMLFKEMYDCWLQSNAILTQNSHTEEALTQLRQRIQSTSNNQKVPKHTFMHHITRMAAAIFLLLAAGYTGYMLHDSQKSDPVIMNKLLTANRSKGRFTLPDGSTVWLNANSMLEYPETFTGEKRVVRLNGEALFDVKKNKDRPFLVQADGMDIEVLGTRFQVQNYPDKAIIETVLEEGSVKVGGSYFPHPTILVPGQLITYNKENTHTDIKSVNSSDYTNWIHSKLVFDNSLLADIIINIQKWYGVDIVAPTSLTASTRMSFTIRNESLDEILKYMSLTIPVSYQWENNKLYLSLPDKKASNKR